jgi:transcription termination/antitermination protein NusG
LEKKWYVVRTYSGHEQKVKSYLEKEVQDAGLSERITSILVPSEKVFSVKDGKKKSKTKTYFPGYILVEASLDKETTHFILESPSVMGFVGPKNTPVALRPDEIRRLIGKMEDRRDSEVIDAPFHVGEPVKVIDGPFTNFTGFVQEVNEEKMKLKLMVSIFGRKTPVELDFDQVEAEK